MPSPYSGVDAIGNPVDLLMRLRVLFGVAEGEKMTFAPDVFTSWVIVLRLDGRKTPPVVWLSNIAISTTPKRLARWL